MIDLGFITYYLRITIIQNCTNCILCLGQFGYFKQVFGIYKMLDFKPIVTLMNTLLMIVAIDYQYTSKFCF